MELFELVESETSVLLLLAQEYWVTLFQAVFFLIDKDIPISLPDPSAFVAGLSFFPLSEAKRRLEPLSKLRFMCSLGVIEDQSVDTSTGNVMGIQAGFRQRFPISLLDEPIRQGTMP